MAAALSAILAAGVSVCAAQSTGSAQDGGQTAPPSASRALLGSLQDAFVSVADACEPAVVTISARKTVRSTDIDDDGNSKTWGQSKSKTYRSQGTGSGVIISSDGWIVTNDHVVGNAERVMVRLHDGRELEGTVRRDYRSDLAVVKLTGESFPFVRLGDSDRVRVGQWSIAIGSPYKYEGSFSVGVISALGRKQEIRDQNGEGDGRLYPDMIQTDAAINPGNSGGPLINLDGEVIAINTAIESENGGSVGIGFAIPANQVRFVVEQLRSKGTVSYGYLGVEPETITPRLSTAYKVESGALVKAEPTTGSPAARAGLHVEDVITSIGSTPIRNERDFRITVSRTAPGTEVGVTVVRSGATRTVRALITEPPAIKVSQVETGLRTAGLGVEVAGLTRDVAARVGLDGKSEGVVIRSLESGSSVSDTEMRAGDVILKINGAATPTVEAFRKVTKSLARGELVRILWQGKRYPETIKRLSIITLE
jgi:serine protease Do